MRALYLIFSILAVFSAACDSEKPARESAAEADLSGLWKFAWKTDGKDDADILTVKLEQTGASVSGRGCSVKYEERGGLLYLGSATCDKESYEGTLRGSSLVLNVSETGNGEPFVLTLALNSEGTQLQGTGAGARCSDCAVSATRRQLGESAE
jgi:hypothetical protein